MAPTCAKFSEWVSPNTLEGVSYIRAGVSDARLAYLTLAWVTLAGVSCALAGVFDARVGESNTLAGVSYTREGVSYTRADRVKRLTRGS